MKNYFRLIFFAIALCAVVPYAMADSWYKLKHKASGMYVQFPATETSNPVLASEGSIIRFVHAADGAVIQNTEGQYLCANSNGWSINATADAAQAMSIQPFALSDGTLTLRYRNGKGFGTDDATAGSKLFYDKSRQVANSHFTLEEVAEQTAAEAALGSVPCISLTANVTDRQLVLSKAGDLHLWAATDVLQQATVDFRNENAWLILDHIRPQECIDKYLSSMTVNGERAVLNQNIRVAIYRDGCAVIPHDTRYQAFVGYYDADFQGQQVSLAVGNHNTLGQHANQLSGFVLKRGYMATISTNADGTGYSRVYVADHSDIAVSQLPTASDNRISSIIVRKWNYNNKKGWGSTGNNTGESNTVRATWMYSWSAGYSSGNNQEYAPHKSHMYWPSWSEINGKSGSNHVLGYNEPEHSEQHSDNCGTTISEWTAFQHSDEFLTSGMRIGSPSPTDASWLTNYIGYLDGYARRCDFVTYHAYWTGDIASWKSRLESIHNNTKRPIWITEMEYGASWESPGYSDVNSAKNKYQQIFNLLEQLDYVEAYFPYNTDLWYNRMIYEQGGLTPAGQLFRDWDSDFAYQSRQQLTPLWWQPSAADVSLRVTLSGDAESIVFQATNPNLDYTVAQYIQRLNPESEEWETILSDNNRPNFDAETNSYTTPLQDSGYDLQTDQFRLCVQLNTGKEVVSLPAQGTLIQNGAIHTTDKSTIPNWTCMRSAQNGPAKATGDTYMEVWDAKAQGMQFDYYQLLTDLPAGYYSLSAHAFHSANGVAGDCVNGSVGIYAQVGKIRYFQPVDHETIMDDSLRLCLPYIYVAAGDTLRLGIRNIAAMTARWAGADNFVLTYRGKAVSAMNKEACQWAREQADSIIAQSELQGVINQLQSLQSLTTSSYSIFQRYAQAIAVAHSQRYAVSDAEAHTSDLSSVIINADAHRANTYGWTASNVDFDAKNAWDGTASGNSYFNYWSGTAFESELTQNIAHLPQGDYRLTCLYRGSTSAQLTLSVMSGNKQLATVTLDPQGEVTVSGQPYPKGWQLAELPFTLPMNASLTLRFHCQGAANAWWSADHFGLQYLTPLTDAIQNPAFTPQPVSRSYDLNGRPAHKSQRGIVVQQGRKVIVNK